MKVFLMVVIVGMLFSSICFAAEGEFKSGSEPDGFGGIKWGTDIRTLPDMEFLRTGNIGKATLSQYTRKGDKIKIGSLTFENVEYWFWRKRFSSVVIRLQGFADYQDLKEALFEKFGPGKQRETERFDPRAREQTRVRDVELCQWLGKITTITLTYVKIPEIGTLVVRSKEIYNQIVEYEKKEYEQQRRKEGALPGKTPENEKLVEDKVIEEISFVQKSKLAVVQITTEKIVASRYGDPFREFFGDKGKQMGLGSGFIVDKEGYILTNNHIIANADTIKVTLFGESVEVKIIGKDPKTDLALIKIESSGKELPVAKLGNSDEIKVGDEVFTVGNLYGAPTVSLGTIIHKPRQGLGIGRYEDFIQTDVPSNPGNSGGPLLNAKGEVVGINVFIRSPSGIATSGFAIPVNIAKNILLQLKEKGKVSRGYLGVYLRPLTEELAKSLGLEKTEGVLIGDVMKDGPAEKGGLKSRDVIIQFDKKAIKNSKHLQDIVANTPPSKVVELKIIRKGIEKVVELRIGEMQG